MVSPPSNDPFLGRKLGGRVELRARVGAGGMGAVYKGWHLTLNQQVAVKLLTPSPGFPLLAKRLAAEIAAARRISHPNVVKVIESGADALDGTPYVVMEYVEGRDLERLLAEAKLLPVGRACSIACAVLEGIAAAHALKVLHRDLKPANIMLTRARHDDGTYGDKVKLIDLGLAKLTDGTALTDTGFVAGTPGYMSPEQAMGEPLDGRSDLYSVGVTLYRMLAGRMPFKGDRWVAIVQAMQVDPQPIEGLPEGLFQVLLRALARYPEDRFPTAQAFAEALAPYVDVSSSAAPPAPEAGVRLDQALGLPSDEEAAPPTRNMRLRPRVEPEMATPASTNASPPRPAAPTPSLAGAGASPIELSSSSVPMWRVAVGALVLSAALGAGGALFVRNRTDDAQMDSLIHELAWGNAGDLEQRVFAKLPALAGDPTLQRIASRALELRRADRLYPYEPGFRLELGTFEGRAGEMQFTLTITSLAAWTFEGRLEWRGAGVTAAVRGIHSGNQVLFTDPELVKGTLPGYVFNEVKHAFVLRSAGAVVLVGSDGPTRRPLLATRTTPGAIPSSTVSEWPSESYITEPQLVAYLRLRAAKAVIERDGLERTAVALRAQNSEAALGVLRLELRERERRLGDAQLTPAQRVLLDSLVLELFEVRLLTGVPTLVPRAEPQVVEAARQRYGALADRLLAHQVQLLTGS